MSAEIRYYLFYNGTDVLGQYKRKLLQHKAWYANKGHDSKFICIRIEVFLDGGLYHTLLS